VGTEERRGNFRLTLPSPGCRIPPIGGTLPTGLNCIDELLGGGLPLGRIVELYGGPDTGKTTLALNWVAAAQRTSARCVLVDAERSLDLSWATQCGVNSNELVLLRPDCGDSARSMTEAMLRTFGIDLLVIDSAAAIVSEREMETSLDDDLPLDLQTDYLASFLRRITGIAARSRCCVLVTNQTRTRFDGREASVSERALSLYSWIRVQVRTAAEIFDGGQIIGKRLALLTTKNKFVEPYAEAGVDLIGPKLSAAVRKGPDRDNSGARAARQQG